MWLWCKRCFGIKTLPQYIAEELRFAKLEEYVLLRQIHHDQHRLRYIKQRIGMLEKV